MSRPALATDRPSAPWHDAVETLADTLAGTAVARDARGGHAAHERALLRDSGLLGLSTPTDYGGQGANWQATLDVVRRFARVDSSFAHLFGFHHLLLATTRLFGRPAQWQSWYGESIRQRWFWGNALNPRDTDTRVTFGTTDVPGRGLLDGSKRFCSGATGSDMLLVSALDPDDRLRIGVVPTRRAGIAVLDDWDNMGQRQTDSGTVTFSRVPVEPVEWLTDPGPLSTPFACLRPLLAQLILANLYLGLGEGAFQEARSIARQGDRAWSVASPTPAREDPYVLAHFGDFWLALEGARALTDAAARAFDQAWERDTALTAAERGAVAVAVATAKVATTRAGLDVTHRMFEVTGARATTAGLRLDRYWRNARVHTLHDPVDYKVRELGDWALNDAPPTPTFYS